MGHIEECKEDTIEEVQHNRHHLLYPKRVWTEAGEDARYIRGMFVVNLPIEFHKELHQQIDKQLGDVIMVYHLPSKSELKRIANLVRKNERDINRMSPIKKLLWLWTVLPADRRSYYVETLITQEVIFLRTRKGEY